MGFFELLGIFVFLYYLISVVLWLILDSDIELSFKEKFGKPISDLRGKVVWITGASSGIGKGLAISLAKNGVRLALSARREDELEKVKKECITASNGSLTDADVLVLKMDLLQIDSHDFYLQKVVDYFGSLHILVNNAGRSQRANWDEIEIEVDRNLFELDVFAVVNLTRVAVRYFKKCTNSSGHVAVTSSGGGVVSLPFSASYSGAKHALHGYYGSLVIEEPSINVTLFCPGPIATEFLQESFTAKTDVKYGIAVSPDDKRMTYQRCGELFAVALANKTYLSWAGLFPVSILLYISAYFPNVRRLILIVLGKEGMNKIREGK